VDGRLSLVQYKGDTGLGEQPKPSTRMIGRVLLSIQLTQQADSLIETASDGAQDQELTNTRLIIQSPLDGLLKIGTILIRIFRDFDTLAMVVLLSVDP